MEHIKEPIIEKCIGCEKKTFHNDAEVCSVYLIPNSKWRNNMNCPVATHIKREVKKDDFKLNPLKASKRGGRK